MESKTKKKLATAVAGVAVAGAAVSLTAGTFSYFTDSATSDVQSLSTGNLKIGASFDHDITITNAAPGRSESVTFTVANNGTVDGYLYLSVKDAGSNSSMKDALQLCITNTQLCGSLGAVENATKDGVFYQEIKAGGSQPINVTVTLPDDGNQNALQDKQAKAVVEATLKSVPQS